MKFQQNDYRDDRKLWQMITECRRYDEMGLGKPDLTLWLQLVLEEETIFTTNRTESIQANQEVTI
jgi:hypothetical protein